MPRRSLRALVLGMVAFLALSGCGGTSKAPVTRHTVAATPLVRLNTDALKLARVDFCRLLSSGAVRDALGGHPAEHKDSWRNGESATVDTGITDVVHEYGCSWTAGTSTAQAWVFARPVTPAFAGTVLQKTAKRTGCTVVKGASFGTPSQRQRCRMPDGTIRDRLSGLFDDTWLTCQVAAAATDQATLDARVDAWCVQVANATNTAR